MCSVKILLGISILNAHCLAIAICWPVIANNHTVALVEQNNCIKWYTSESAARRFKILLLSGGDASVGVLEGTNVIEDPCRLQIQK